MNSILLLAAVIGLCAGNLQQYYNYPAPPQQSLYIRGTQPPPVAPGPGQAITFPDDVTASTQGAINGNNPGAQDPNGAGSSTVSTTNPVGVANATLETEIIKAILVKEIENQTDAPTDQSV